MNSWKKSLIRWKSNTRRISTQRILGPPRTPRNSLRLGFFLCFERKGGPKHKEFAGLRAPLEGGGSRSGVSGEILMFMPFFGPDLREVIFSAPMVLLSPTSSALDMCGSCAWIIRCSHVQMHLVPVRVSVKNTTLDNLLPVHSADSCPHH